ncbi:peroxidase family protein [Roseobacter sp.]|uniref:peroxidase family protein n=1 Tax=Roseobacter sp. TaxID=1907202 RepID=UPI0038597B27
MANSSTLSRNTVFIITCLIVALAMTYRGYLFISERPGDGALRLLGVIHFVGIYGIFTMWRGWRHGFWLLTGMNIAAAALFIFVVKDAWLRNTLIHFVFSAAFWSHYPFLKISRPVELMRRKVLGTIGDAAMSLLNVPWIVKLIGMIPPLDAWINRIVINRIVNQVRNRPHPFSTKSSYTSWSSLTDKTWSARHLGVSPIDQTTLPPFEKLRPLFARTQTSQRKCPKSTCLFPSFAQYLTDGFIRTVTDENVPDRLKKTTSNHNIDLCPLYGRTAEQTAALRVQSPNPEDRGKLKSQIENGEEFAPFLYDGDHVKPEFEVLDPPLGVENLDTAITSGKPKVAKAAREKRGRIFAFGGDRANSVPQTAMINTLLLREHNRLARELGERNPKWDDDRVFETARNIVVVQFIKVVVEDYINHIAPTEFRMKADPKAAWKAKWNRPNWITTEFSLLYRWHALIPDEITWGDTTHKTNPSYFLNNLPLIQTGLAQSFEDMSAQKAGELGPQNTTKFLLNVEEASVEQGRFCEIRPFTDYLEYLERMPIENMSGISSDRDVATLLQEAYGDVEKVDFFVGIFCEDRVKNAPLPSTILSFVALDAFSQALTNPLLSEHVFKPPTDPEADHPTFSRYGWEQISACSSVRDLVQRNIANPESLGFVGMTQTGWQRE